ncbi:unnamed protein product [Auanema sp. JU1783]|nr:unnamed protein product [Auanema sp. JU1783]
MSKAVYTRLPPLPALRDFINMYRLRAKKILSQNYIMDMNVTRKIIRSAQVKEGDWVTEVGPGPGGITRAILEAGASRLDVVEIDHRFIPPLQHLAEAADGRLNIHHSDVLKTNIGEIWSNSENHPQRANWHDDPPTYHVIGNLPFNIASPLIIKFLKDMSYRRGPWEFGRVPLTLTFQLEVAQRICSPIASDSRSRLSIMSQYVSEPKLVFKIPGSCFVPRPEVDVGVVRFVPRRVPLINVSFEVVEKLCRQVFHYRQKYVLKGLRTLYPEEISFDMAHSVLSKSGVDPTTTSVRIGIDEFALMALEYERQCVEMPGLFLYDYTKPKKTLEILKNEKNCLPPMNLFKNDQIPKEGISLKDCTLGS